MRPTVTDRVAWSVGRSVTLVSHAKTAAPIEMSFGLWARMGRRNHVLDQGPEVLVLDQGPEVLRDVAMATTFWLSMGYNFGCMILGGGFLGSSYPMKTQAISRF